MPDNQSCLEELTPDRHMAGVPPGAPPLRFYVQGSREEGGGGGSGGASASGGSAAQQQGRTYAFFLPRYEKVLAYYQLPAPGEGGGRVGKVRQLLVTPARFEADAGSKSKKWKESCRTDEGGRRLSAKLAELYPAAYGKPAAGTPAPTT